MAANAALDMPVIEDVADYRVSGRMTKGDTKALANATRTGTVGPTTVYYAGLTAPIISASMSLVARNAFESTTLSTYWVFLLSAFCAVAAGISWYLIFMRWSYRHHKSRAGEQASETRVHLLADGVCVQRDHVTTHIMWPGIKNVSSVASGLIIHPAGASAIFIANRWFDVSNASKGQFERRILDQISGDQPSASIETISPNGQTPLPIS